MLHIIISRNSAHDLETHRLFVFFLSRNYQHLLHKKTVYAPPRRADRPYTVLSVTATPSVSLVAYMFIRSKFRSWFWSELAAAARAPSWDWLAPVAACELGGQGGSGSRRFLPRVTTQSSRIAREQPSRPVPELPRSACAHTRAGLAASSTNRLMRRWHSLALRYRS